MLQQNLAEQGVESGSAAGRAFYHSQRQPGFSGISHDMEKRAGETVRLKLKMLTEKTVEANEPLADKNSQWLICFLQF